MKQLTVLDRWNNFKRLLLVVFSILMWVMSIVFSYFGFKSGVRSEWYFGMFAIILSGAITTMELYLNSQTFDFSAVNVGLIVLWIGGIVCYLYGIWTNIIGVGIMMLGTGDLTTVGWQAQVVPVAFGILLEVLPEPMMIAFFTSKKVVIPADLARTQNQQQNNQQRPKNPYHPIGIPEPIRKHQQQNGYRR